MSLIRCSLRDGLDRDEVIIEDHDTSFVLMFEGKGSRERDEEARSHRRLLGTLTASPRLMSLRQGLTGTLPE
jgi:hypothetical protein